MRTTTLTTCLLLSLATGTFAGNPTTELHPNDAEALKAARITVACKFLNGHDYAFEITADVPKGFDSIDASFAIRNNKDGLVTYIGWPNSKGKIVAVFMVGRQAVKDAVFGVQSYVGDPIQTAGWAASGYHVLKLSEFADALAGPRPAAVNAPARPNDEFEITTPLSTHGPKLTVAVKPKENNANHLYAIHVTVEGRSDQHFEVRNGQPITQHDLRLASLNANPYLDIMIPGGTDPRGETWYKTLIYNEKKQAYHWIGE